MRLKTEQDPQDEALEALFEETSAEPSNELLGRMMARAAEVPRARVALPWWRRLLEPAGLLPTAGMSALAGVLLFGLLLSRGTPVTPITLPAPTFDGSVAALESIDDSDGLADLDDGDLFDALDPVDDREELLTDLEPPHVDYQGVEDRVWIQVYDALLARND